MSKLTPALGLAALLAGCATAPEPPPSQALPAAYAQAPNQAGRPSGQSAGPASAADAWVPAATPVPAGAWWSVFGDARLDALERRVEQGNQTLAAQLAAYDQARAALGQARAAEFPTVGATASATRGSAAATGGGIGQSVSAGLDASWTPDVWGRVRLQVRAAGATAAASAATLRATRLSLQASLAQAYLQLCTVDAQLALSRDTVAAYQREVDLTEARYRAGVDTAAAVAAARTQLLQAQAAQTDLGATRVQLQDAIAVLVGEAPAEIHLDPATTLPEVPTIPPGVPSELLQRRPDLEAARDAVDAANAQIGVAQTAWLPSLTLGASSGSTASRMAELFKAPTTFWSVGPALAATLFDGGLRSAQVDIARASWRQSVANWRGGVLGAMQQVEDQLAAQRVLATEAGQQAQVVESAQTSLRLARNQYRAGTAPYLSVITAETTATAARNAELVLRNRRYAAAVALIQALGGGWGS